MEQVVAVTHWVRPIEQELALIGTIAGMEPAALGLQRAVPPLVVACSSDVDALRKIEAVLRDRGHGVLMCRIDELLRRTQWAAAAVRWARSPGDEVESLAAVFVLDSADLRLRLAGPPPVLLSRRLDQRTAHAWCAVLRDRGHGAVACDTCDAVVAADLPAVRGFELTAEGLEAVDHLGCARSVAFAQIRALVRTPAPVAEQTTVRPQRSVGRGTVVDVKRSTSRIGQQLYLIADPPGSSLLLCEHGLQYAGLGALVMRTTRENFVTVVDQLRQRATSAWYDESLVRAAQQRRGQGPVSPHQPSAMDVAVHLLWQAHQQGQLTEGG